jgi:hypothetical protein
MTDKIIEAKHCASRLRLFLGELVRAALALLSSAASASPERSLYRVDYRRSIDYKVRYFLGDIFHLIVDRSAHSYFRPPLSENAVKSQIWIAVCVYVLIAIVKARFSLTQSYYEILQILSITVFEKTPVFTLFEGENYTFDTCCNPKQLTLFDL